MASFVIKKGTCFAERWGVLFYYPRARVSQTTVIIVVMSFASLLDDGSYPAQENHSFYSELPGLSGHIPI